MPNMKSLSLTVQVIANVKVDNRRTNRLDKNNVPDYSIWGHKKLICSRTLKLLDIDTNFANLSFMEFWNSECDAIQRYIYQSLK